MLNLVKFVAFVRGFTYIGLLILIAIAGIGMSAVGVMWKTEMQRVREIELMHVGLEFKEAIASYRDATPGGIKQNPKKLEDLVADKRLPKIKRHLRKLYLDPMTNQAEWGLEIQQGAIAGVYSLSKLKPLKRAGFSAEFKDFDGADSYAYWVFD